MRWLRVDMSDRGWGRVAVFTLLGTVFCIAVAFLIDGYASGGWGPNPANNLIIPLVLAPPFFFFLLAKQRELAIAHRELLLLATTDTLTSCLNRRAFTSMVEAYLQRVARHQAAERGALLVIDVDHFKRVNDSFGHDRGDQALQIIAGRIRDMVREVDLVGRIGGEEFGVFLPGLDGHRAGTVAERIRAAVEAAKFTPDGVRVPLTVSVGGAAFKRAATFDRLFRAADQRLFAAKNGGRNRIEVAEPAPG